MDPTEFVTKANGTVNSVLDIFKKRWFIALLLWAIMLVELTMLWTQQSASEVLRQALVVTLRLDVLEPALAGLETVIHVASTTSIINIAALMTVTVLVIASVIAFWRDGKELSSEAVVDLAPTNVMLRFAVFTTWASFSGSIGSLIFILAIAALAYSIAAATQVPRHQRVVMFLSAVLFFVLSFAIALLCPAVLLLVGLWNALM